MSLILQPWKTRHTTCVSVVRSNCTWSRQSRFSMTVSCLDCVTVWHSLQQLFLLSQSAAKKVSAYFQLGRSTCSLSMPLLCQIEPVLHPGLEIAFELLYSQPNFQCQTNPGLMCKSDLAELSDLAGKSAFHLDLLHRLEHLCPDAWVLLD